MSFKLAMCSRGIPFFCKFCPWFGTNHSKNAIGGDLRLFSSCRHRGRCQATKRTTAPPRRLIASPTMSSRTREMEAWPWMAATNGRPRPGDRWLWRSSPERRKEETSNGLQLTPSMVDDDGRARGVKVFLFI